ncbi:MAG: C-terminal binding protein [Planctomycetaceae bacterium]|nr:C-terminal binding protein [Planctomycetaceae bacterium]
MLAVRLNSTTYPVEPAERATLEAVGARVLNIEGQQPAEILAAARDCDALLVVSSKVPAEVIEQLTRCRVISRLGAGTDRIDVEAATHRGIVVANVPDFCVNEQAEHTVALLLGWVRRLPYMVDAMRRGEWTARQHSGVHRLAGQTVGLVGFGASAQGVAARLAPFGVRLQAWARNPAKARAIAETLGVQLVGFDQLLAESDFVSLHLPLTPETRGLLGGQQLGRMKPTAVLINTSRGAIIDEAALVAALESGRLGGAALDVFDGIDVFALPGPPPDHPLLKLENVLCTPHCAGSSVESSRDSKARGARNAALVLQGHKPGSIVNPEVVPRGGPLTNAP